MFKSLSPLNYLYLFLAIAWVPFQKVILTVDGAAISLMTLTVIVFIINVFNKKTNKLISSKPISFWAIWVVYSSINLYLKGYSSGNSFISFFIVQLFIPYLVMLLSARELIVNKKRTISFLIIVLFIYAFLSLFLYGFSDIGNIRELKLSGNITTLNLLFLVFFSLLMYIQKWYKLSHVLFFSSIAFFFIISTSTRKALGAAIIFIFFTLISKFKLTVSKIFGLSISLYLGYLAINYLLINTLFGERFMEVESSGSRVNSTNIEALNIFGDRVFFYIEGWALFLDSPITGIGLTNFIKKATYEITIHSEYMVQLTENGLVGFFLFLIFNIWIGKNVIKNLKNKLKRDIYWVLTGGFVAILFINFTAWTYSFPQYFAVFGVIIGYIKLSEDENSNTRK